MGLNDTRKCQGKGHEGHRTGRDPEAPHIELLVIRFTPAKIRQRIGEDCQIKHHIGPVESQMAMCCGNLCSVGVVIDRRQGMHEAPYARAKKRHDREQIVADGLSGRKISGAAATTSSARAADASKVVNQTVN